MNITEPAALLAHWQYRARCLNRDLYEAKAALDNAKTPRRSISLVDDFIDHEPLIEQIELLKYLEAEADYYTYAVQVQIGMDYFTPVRPPQPLPIDLNAIADVLVYVDGVLYGQFSKVRASVSVDADTLALRIDAND